MSDGTGLCIEARVHPIDGEPVACNLPAGHRVSMHCHTTPPMLMYWPVSPVSCPAWRQVNTAMGKVVVFCAMPDARHRPGAHESAIGIQPIVWTDAEVSHAGKIAKGILAVITAECVSGDLAPSYRTINARLGTSEYTCLKAFELLERDGVVKRVGKRWMVL
jgi:hypothetical protein